VWVLAGNISTWLSCPSMPNSLPARVLMMSACHKGITEMLVARTVVQAIEDAIQT